MLLTCLIYWQVFNRYYGNSGSNYFYLLSCHDWRHADIVSFPNYWHFHFQNNVHNKNKTIFQYKKIFFLFLHLVFYFLNFFLGGGDFLCNVLEWWTIVSLFSMRMQPYDIPLIWGDRAFISKVCSSTHQRWRRLNAL